MTGEEKRKKGGACCLSFLPLAWASLFLPQASLYLPGANEAWAPGMAALYGTLARKTRPQVAPNAS